MKKAIIILVVLLILVGGGYFLYQMFFESGSTSIPTVQAPALPETTETLSKEPLVFKAKFNVGEKRVTQIQMISTTDTQIQGGDNKSANTTQNLSMKMAFNEDIAISVLTTRPEGGYEMEFQIEHIQMTMEINTMKISFDSLSNDSSDSKRSMGSIFKGMASQKFKMLTNAKGEPEQFMGLENFGSDIQKNSSAGNPFSSMFNDNAMKSMMKDFNYSNLPDHPIQVGESWPYTTELDIPIVGKMKLNANYTFTGWKQYEGTTCALLSYTGKMTINTSTALAQLPVSMNLKGIDFAGYTFLDPQLGAVKEFSQNQNIVMEMAEKTPTKNPSGNHKMSMKMVQTVKGKLVRVEQLNPTPVLSMNTTATMSTSSVVSTGSTITTTVSSTVSTNSQLTTR